MQLVEQHVIKRSHPAFAEVDSVAFLSKNLYNSLTYIMRQEFFLSKQILSLKSLYDRAKLGQDYAKMPRKVSCLVIFQVFREWKAFRSKLKSFSSGKSKAKPGIPRYKDKVSGRNVVSYSDQAVSKPNLRKGRIKLSGLNFTISTKRTNLDQVRLVPRRNYYVIEVIYTRKPRPARLDKSLYAGIDLGVDNLAAVSSNQPGFKPAVVNGRLLKSINQFFNKRKAKLQSLLPGKRKTSNLIERITVKRNRKINQCLHSASKKVVGLLVASGIGNLVIGKNGGWKNGINIGKRNNQTFVSIPHSKFVHMLKYKAELVGINVVVLEESHTSKCSFLDGEEVCHHEKYLGKRISRGLFRSSSGKTINADINASYNIIRKAFPKAFSHGTGGYATAPNFADRCFGVSPCRWTPCSSTKSNFRNRIL